jgi:hypothetical protein
LTYRFVCSAASRPITFLAYFTEITGIGQKILTRNFKKITVFSSSIVRRWGFLSVVAETGAQKDLLVPSPLENGATKRDILRQDV